MTNRMASHLVLDKIFPKLQSANSHSSPFSQPHIAPMATPTSLDSAFFCRNPHKTPFFRPCNTLPSISNPSCSSSQRLLLPPNPGAAAPVAALRVMESDAPTVPNEVKSLFDENREAVVSNGDDLNDAIIRLFRNPQTGEFAYECYKKARERPDFKPGIATLRHLIRHLIRAEKWDSIASIVADFERFQVLLDSITCSRLVSACIVARKFRILTGILEVFEASDGEVAVSAFSSAMKGYNKIHMYNSTLDVYKVMESKGIALNPLCCYTILEAYLRVGNHEKVVEVFKEFEANTLSESYAPFAAQIYRSVFDSLGKLGQAIEAYELFKEKTLNGPLPLVPNSSIYTTLISSVVSIRDVKVAEEIFREAVRKGVLPNVEALQKLVMLYIEEGLVEKTLEIVTGMKNAKIRVTDNILCAVVNGYSKRRGRAAAAKVYEELVSQGTCEPGQVTYASMISIYYGLGLYPKAEAVFQEMEQRGFDRCLVAYSSMVTMYGKTGRLSDAMTLFAKMKRKGPQPNVWVYNSLLEMYGKVKDLQAVEKLWNEMKRRKLVADKFSYTIAISAYSKADDFDTCTRLYQEYRGNGGEVDRALAGIMVGVFSRTEGIDELVKLLQDMKRAGTSLDGRLYWSAYCALRDAGMSLQAQWLQENFRTASQIVESRGRVKPRVTSVRKKKQCLS